APDPRPPRGDRAAGRRRPRLRRPGSRPGAAVPPRRVARVPAPAHGRARGGRVAAPARARRRPRARPGAMTLEPGEDAYGQILLAALEGREAQEIMERDDGFVYAGDPSTYFAPYRRWPATE